jgi:hypothetical protein
VEFFASSVIISFCEPIAFPVDNSVLFIRFMRKRCYVLYFSLNLHVIYSFISFSAFHLPLNAIQAYRPTAVRLTLSSLAVTLRTTRFKINKFHMLLTLRLCVLYGSENRQRLFAYTALTYRFS